jgi:sugar phosphate isomerase/epimerase
MKPSFSTVALPDWTLARIAPRLEDWGFLAVELRTFGNGSTQSACDPALTASSKVRTMFDKAGMQICSLATGIRYDEIISPPIIGNVISDTERSVRETKGMVDLALSLECPYVRVFAFELPEGETRKSGMARIVGRLKKSTDYCRNSGVKLMLENGGSFNTAVDLAEIIDAVGSPLLTASYSAPVAAMAGESIANGINVLGDRLVNVKVKDLKLERDGGKPVALGTGDLSVRDTFAALAKANYTGWITYEFDRAWLPTAANVDVSAILAQSAKAMFEWSGAKRTYAAAR